MITNVLILLGASLGILYLGMMLFAYAFSDPMIFPAFPSSYEPDQVDAWVESDAGDTLAVRFRRVPDAPFTLLYSHGNGEDLGYIEEVVEAWANHGFQVVSWDYPGYGLSTGRPTEAGCYAGIEAIFQWALKQDGVAADRLIAYGRSLGSGPTLFLAERHNLAGVILEGAFTSTFRVMTHVQIVPFDKFDNLKRLPQVREPLLVLHGEEDRTIPVWHGRALLEAAPGPTRSLFIPGAGHNDLLDVAGDQVFDTVKSFAAGLSGSHTQKSHGE